MKPFFKSRFLHSVEFLILGILITILILSISSFFQNFDNQRELNDFKNNVENKEIQEWMTLQFISREFEIDKKYIEEILKFKPNNRDSRIPLKKLCEIKKLNCEEIILNLNNNSELKQNRGNNK